MVGVLQVQSLVRLVFWLKKTDLGLSFMLAFVSFIAVVWIAASHPGGWLEALFEGPAYSAGFYVGTIVFPNYTVRGTNGFYWVPVFGAAGDFLAIMAFWFISLRTWRWLRAEKNDTDLHQPTS
jgi:hypothetical protein